MQDDDKIVNEIVAKMIAMPSPVNREEMLEKACGGNDALRAAVELRLKSQATGPAIAGGPVFDPSGTTDADPSSGPFPGQILAGRYQLREEIGAGGMGTVWVATQATPVKRRVALKLIKAGMDSRALLARFEAERQALALMDHPNIAKVFDGGITEQGRPFFVMEYVRGVSLTEYCDQARLAVRDRIELFRSVCQAVQHAHQKGVIHRDLKPSNILVHLHDGQPSPMIIDFGLAKALGASLTEQTIFTETGTMVGTPLYMSPEQADRSSLDIDTRADIYSLGVILYELLTGTTPLERQEVKKAAHQEVLRLIKDKEPPRPSVRLSGSNDLPDVAAHRRIDPRELRKTIAGDLDWIVMKALEKDRTRRYATANGFAEDLRRYLDGQAVEAAPPSRRYLISKFIRRNRPAVAAATLVAGTLLVGITGTTIGMRWALRERTKAVNAGLELQQRADELQQVSQFQAKMLADLKPSASGRWLTEQVLQRMQAGTIDTDLVESDRAKQFQSFQENWNRINTTDLSRDFIDYTILQPAIAAIDTQFAEQPLVDARLRQSLADLYRNLGLHEASTPLQDAALRIRIRELGEDDLETIASKSSKGILLRMQGRWQEAEPYYRETLAVRRKKLGNDHIDTIDAIGNLGVLVDSQGKKIESGELYREALERSRQNLGNDHEYTLISSNNLGLWLYDQGNYEEAESLYKTAIENAERSSKESGPGVNILISLAELYQKLGRFQEAEDRYKQALESLRRSSGARHPRTLAAMHMLAFFYSGTERLEEAVDKYREVVIERSEALSENHPETLQTMHNLAGTLSELGQWEEAEQWAGKALEGRKVALPKNHWMTCQTASRLGWILLNRLKFEEAEQQYERWFENVQTSWGESDIDTLWFEFDWMVVLRDSGKLAESQQRCQNLLNKANTVKEATPDLRANLEYELARIQFERNQQDLLEPAASMAQKSYESFIENVDAAGALDTSQLLTSILLARGVIDEAETRIAGALDASQGKVAADHASTLNALRSRASVHIAKDEHEAAIALLAPLEETARRVLTGRNTRQLGKLLLEIGRAHAGLGQRAKAEASLTEARQLLSPFGGANDRYTGECAEAIKALKMKTQPAIEPR